MKFIKNGFGIIPAVMSAVILAGCVDDGKDGTNGDSGVDGKNSLVVQTILLSGNEQCFKGGTRLDTGIDNNANGELDTSEIKQTSYLCSQSRLNTVQNFIRIASFPVCSQIDINCDTETETAAEIVAASSDGRILIYTDSPTEKVGFVDINNPDSPVGLGSVALSGEPTSVAVKDDYALVAVNTSTDFINVSGELVVINIGSQTLVTSIALGGQPDSIAVSPDGNYAAVVIENERDEDLSDGTPPQLPAGSLVVIDTSNTDPSQWSSSTVDLTGIASLYSSDPEPEYVDINANNIAVVTLQENNHIVLVDLTDGSIVEHFSAGSVDLSQIDATEGKLLKIDQVESLTGITREPDGVSWINRDYFATADEGDLNGGSRGFTIFNTKGEVVWSSGAELDHMAAQFGHYPDKRSGNKGNEPENVEVGIYGVDRYLFVNSERSSLVFVYDVADPKKPIFKQVLPAAAGPEGGLSIPSRNLLVVASEEDSRGDKLRSTINIYRYQHHEATYPTIKSVYRTNGTPISWGALSGLSADPVDEHILYSVEDSFYQSNRIFTLDVSQAPAKIIKETTIKDTNDIFVGISTVILADESVDADDATRINVFDSADLKAMLNDDKTVNIDPEGIAKSADGGFWVASEGSGSVGDSGRPINSLNFLFKIDSQGVITRVITLPETINNKQIRFGFEGVAEYGNKVYVVFQRAWEGDTNPRIGIYDLINSSWSFVFYPLDMAESQNGGWVGLSDITALENGEFLILERDNQGGPDAVIKRLYRIDLSSPVANSVVDKSLVKSLITDLQQAGGLVAEKVEGSAVMANGDVYIVNDNDGVDDNSGETQLINLGKILH
ncbi:esterase-like activity of phytase family protein [Aliikangiella sp. IMCC44359]|uniref:esterase-like activity of phytase family protein n=1 Tax=Aliikangiella sp. IMCC44359 TaxID=3459125 RepID=UPI00403B1E3A